VKESSLFELSRILAVHVGSLGLVGLTARTFDANNWPLFHSWALSHGSFVILWPVCVMLFTFASVPTPGAIVLGVASAVASIWLGGMTGVFLGIGAWFLFIEIYLRTRVGANGVNRQ
jgi:hypothetical protein